MKASQPKAFLAAIFGADRTDPEQALKGLRALGVKAWLVSSADANGKAPSDALQLSPTLLPGEFLVVARVSLAGVEAAVSELSSIGAPAIFVLPGVVPPAARGRKSNAAAAAHLPPSTIKALAEEHGQPGSCGPQPSLFSLLTQYEQRLEFIRRAVIGSSRLDHTLSPAAVWLIDNGYLFEVHIAEVRKNLPKEYHRLLPAPVRTPGIPRVCALAVELVRQTDSLLTADNIAECVEAYQSKHLLTMAELWAFPQMLRLALIEELVSTAGEVHRSQQLRQFSSFWANRLGRAARAEESQLKRILAHLERQPYFLDPDFITSLSEQLRDESTAHVALQRGVEGRSPLSIGEIVRQEHNEETANRVSIANAVASLRQLALLEFQSIFEATSAVERILQEDPGGVHGRSDFSTRDRCRHAVEQISRTGPLDEFEVARRAVRLAGVGAPPVENNIAHYLLGGGRERLESECHSRPLLGARFLRLLRRRATPVYLIVTTLLTLSFLSVMMVSAWESGMQRPATLLLLAMLGSLPFSDLAIQIVNALIFRFFPPDELPSLALRDGIPPESATLVVIPMMFSSPDAAAKEAAKLEVRYLGNPEPHLYFALFPDFLDADSPTEPEDAGLLAGAFEAIAELNRRHGPKRFFLFHRQRLWSGSEDRWMGRERKRGKVEELNAFLLGEGSGAEVSEPLPEPVRYVIALDADTQLPPETARRMVATLSHPLNRVELTPDGRNRARGYTIIQPRVSIGLPGATASRFTRIFADASGTDPYCQAVSDAYQDLFREGIFHGKAIYDLHGFHAILNDRFPVESLLSHDLIEGAHVGVASASSIEIFENMPADYASYARRQHRWIRGDWQIGPWIARHVPGARGEAEPNPLSIISRWRILDNLRRSLVAPATMLLLIWGWFGSSTPGAWTFLLAVAATLPGLAPLSERVAKRFAGSGYGLPGAWEELLRPLVTVSLLPHQAWISLDAVTRTLHRQLVSGKRLLEWQTAEQSESQAADHQHRTIVECITISAVSLFVLIALSAKGAFWATIFFLLLWMLSPLTVIWLSRRTGGGDNRRALNGDQTPFLSRMARLTWRYFDDLVGPADHWLPPDNTQLALRIEVAHRTSPTNVGLWLTSALAAHDLGFVTTDRVLSMCTETVDTLARMERYEGHWLNWYNTETLEPLLPRYVSTVDSGNLLASFWVLEQGLGGIEAASVLGGSCLRGLEASVLVLAEAFGGDHSARLPLNTFTRLFGRPAVGQEIADKLALLAAPVRQLAATRRWQPAEPTGDRDYWIAKLEEQVSSWSQHVRRYLPWLETLAAAPDPFLNDIHPGMASARRRALVWTPSLADLAEGKLPPLDELLELGSKAAQGQQKTWISQIRAEIQLSRQAASETCQRIAELRRKLRDLAETVDMGFLYDPKRRLLGIGYQVGGPLEFGGYYDFLASECRLASLVAIAKGDVPLEHWMALGRPYLSTPEGQTLLSWSGTMFEFLMPLVYTRAFENSFLASACLLAVRKQMEYAGQKGIPWGISEAAYSAIDANKIYQYRAFGVPGLGLKEGLEKGLVVSPYSTFLSLQLLPNEAVFNLQSLVSQGMSGPMGLYESLDYSRERTRRGGRGVIVYAYMAHHQGMSLLAMDNVLNDGVMQRRFHADPRIQAFESLLFEKVPSERSLLRRTAPDGAAFRVESEPETSPRTWQEDSPVPRVNLLGNGHYTLMVTSSGSGFSRWKQFDLTDWSADTTQDRMGSYFYIRDRRSGAVWSATRQPLAGEAGSFTCNFSADRAEFFRRVSDVETVTAICVSSEADVEVRRLTFTNHGLRTRALELTSYCELALAEHKAQRAHPVFSKLFVETEVLPGGQTLIAHRRPRSPDEAPVWMAQMVVTGQQAGAIQHETSRMAFLGRHRSTADPVALTGELTGSVGTVLDPVFSLRCRFALAPRGQVEISYLTLAAASREELLVLVERFRYPEAVTRAFETAWTQAQLEFRYLGIDSSAAHRFQELLSPLIYPQGGLRPAPARLVANRLGQSGLWAHGISGDLPILAVTVADVRGISLVRDLLVAHSYWRMRGFPVDLVVLDQEPHSYEQALREQIGKLVEAHMTQAATTGGVFLLNWQTLTEESRTLMLEAGRAVLGSGRGNLTQQLAAPLDSAAMTPLMSEASARNPVSSSELPFLELPYFNGLGGFSKDGREYDTYLKARETTPLPWSNVIATPHFGTVVTESGLGYTWFGNSQSNRLTPWQNDPVCDPQAEVIYIRDQETGEVWTPTALPIREETAYRARHGQGYTVFEHNSHAIRQELTVFVPLDESGGEPLKIARLRLHNEDRRRRSLTVTWYVEWVLGVNREESQEHVQTSFDVDSSSLLARNVWQPSFAGRVAFIAMSPQPLSWTGDRTAFLGRNGQHRSPDAMKRIRLDLHTGAGLDPAGALQTRLFLEPGESVDVICLLGQGSDVAEVRSLVAKYRTSAEVDAALARTKAWWDERLSRLEVRVPVLSVGFLLNRWLPYQVLSCRFWARSAYYQSGGAYGFRDQLQDSMALVYWAPEMARQHLLTAASRQFTEGDVQHWWHVETGAGPRTRCSDDMLWLVYATAHYVRVTGDEGVLREAVSFLDGPQLEPGSGERLFTPNENISPAASLFEHCCRSIERASTFGPHGLPLFGGGDWNDGMNLVGAHGTGESVWLAWFLAAILKEFAPLAARFRGEELADTFRQRARALTTAVDAHGWDGAWYLRGFFDDGTPLGSAQNQEAQIDSLTQSWAVLAGGGDPDRARLAIDSAVKHLVRAETGQVLLFTPPFNRSTPNPGYIMGYPPGIRENGGQYTHGSLWLPMAFAQLGLGTEAAAQLQIMNPVEAARNPKSTARYGGEPFVAPADVYSNPQHDGRCGWTWYTGSAAWMYRAWIESILGFHLQGDYLSIEPALPAEWNEFELNYRHGQARYRIRARRDHAVRHRRIVVNGAALEGQRILLIRTPSEHEVVVLLPGSDRESDRPGVVDFAPSVDTVQL